MLVYRGLEADTMNIYGVRNDGTWARFHGVVCSTANRSRDCISTMARKSSQGDNKRALLRNNPALLKNVYFFFFEYFLPFFFVHYTYNANGNTKSENSLLGGGVSL